MRRKRGYTVFYAARKGSVSLKKKKKKKKEILASLRGANKGQAINGTSSKAVTLDAFVQKKRREKKKKKASNPWFRRWSFALLT